MIVSTILHVPTEGVEYGHKHFKHAWDVLVGQLLVFDAFEKRTTVQKATPLVTTPILFVANY